MLSTDYIILHNIKTSNNKSFVTAHHIIVQRICIIVFPFVSVVSGDANFNMVRTGMTLGEFVQPSVACLLIEIPANVEKGLCQWFLWLAPKPSLIPFNQLQKVDVVFATTIG